MTVSDPNDTRLDASVFLKVLAAEGIEFFAGIPDSLLKDLCAAIAGGVPEDLHVIAANEGGAVAMATGYHLATGRIGAVYLQNSGLGNAMNPLTSLVDPGVYGVPVLLIVGWRGEPGHADEPQHLTQGRTTLAQLDAIGVPHAVLPARADAVREVVGGLVDILRSRGGAVALIVRAGTFAGQASGGPAQSDYPLRREDAIRAVVDTLGSDDIVVSTTGMTSRELYEYRVKRGDALGHDFLTVGSMGHSSQIALGIAISMPGRHVYCLDGDGAAIMHMGGMAIIGSRQPSPLLRHIILNNGAHDSVGGQPTAGFSVEMVKIAQGCGYAWAGMATTLEEIAVALAAIRSIDGPTMLEIRVSRGARSDLGRPLSSPKENRDAFMTYLAEGRAAPDDLARGTD